MSVLILQDLPCQKLSPRASSPPVPGPAPSLTGSHHLVAQFCSHFHTIVYGPLAPHLLYLQSHANNIKNLECPTTTTSSTSSMTFLAVNLIDCICNAKTPTSWFSAPGSPTGLTLMARSSISWRRKACDHLSSQIGCLFGLSFSLVLFQNKVTMDFYSPN